MAQLVQFRRDTEGGLQAEAITSHVYVTATCNITLPTLQSPFTAASIPNPLCLFVLHLEGPGEDDLRKLLFQVLFP